CMQHLEYPFTF
nr:immunoglobulin light chain junction region [Mus musculus]NSL97798.1 immunoglobulin light chain junction region [Mus musculus]NSL98491.1 immunoglobulin light chain junction region [Mus musculus]NSL98789.1 immunoglobulin light chain junction region [Mus musculus]NSM00541.1 immunoglobulin light chain junction region [Mus musculus]